MTEAMKGHVRRPERIHALTSLRFFAALYVVCFHALSVSSYLPWITHESLLGRFVGLGYVSVSFFFLLSGYILGVVYLRSGATVRLGSFFKARFARVYPLLFLTLVLDAPNLFLRDAAVFGSQKAAVNTGISFLGNAALLQAWMLRFRFLNEASWSLSAEAIFYLSFPFVGVLLWKLRGSALWVTVAVLYLGGQGVVLLAAQHVHGELIKRLPLLHLTTFALGILLARWQMLRQQKLEEGYKTGRTTRLVASLVLALAAICCAAVVYWSPRIPIPILHDGLLAPVFMCLIWAFAQPKWLPARILGASWLVVAGEASYGLYLIHTPVAHMFEWLGWDRIPAMFPVYVATSIGLSVVSFYSFETPMRRWILKRGPKHVKETMETASDAQ